MNRLPNQAALASLVRELADIRARVDERHQENQRQFAALVSGQAAANEKLDSLLTSRSFTRGVIKTVVVISSGVSAVVGLIIAYFSSGYIRTN